MVAKRFQDKNDILSNLDFREFYNSEIEKLSATKNNGQAIGLCPFHQDSNPSLSVNIENGLFKCFGCHTEGDVFNFYMKRYDVDFKRGLEKIINWLNKADLVKLEQVSHYITLKITDVGRKVVDDVISR